MKYSLAVSKAKEYLANNQNFSYFKGKIALHKYTDYFTNGYFNKGDIYCPDNLDENGDPISCDDYYVNDSFSGGGDDSNNNGDYVDSGDTSGSGSSASSGGSESNCVKRVEQCWCEGQLWGVHEHQETVISWDCHIPEYYKGTDDCPDCPNPDGGIAVNSEENINYDLTITECVKMIIENLKEKDNHYSVIPDISDLEGVSHLSSIILNLFDSSKLYDLNFSIVELGLDSEGNEINGQTSKSSTSNGWDIKVDKGLVKSGTQLFIAKTIIHEAMHTFIKHIINTNKTSDLVSDLQIIYLQTDEKEGLTHHEFMSQYVEAFAQSLAAWDNHRQTNEYYKSLSWGGLERSSNYQALTNKSEIQTAIQNERYGKSNAKGEKCN